MMTAPEPVGVTAEVPSDLPRWRRYCARILFLLFCLCTALSLLTIWTHNQINDSDRYVRTVAPLASEPAMQAALANQVSTGLGEALSDVLARDGILDREPYLAAPLARLLEQYVNETVHAYVASPAFPAQWEQINREVHPVVAAILAGEDIGNVGTADGRVTLDLMPLMTEVINRLRSQGVDVVDRIQVDQLDTSFVMFQSDDLDQIQDLIRFLGWLSVVLPLIALLSLGGYIGLSTGRWQAVIWAGVGLAVTMALFLLLLAFARWLYLDRLDPEMSHEAAAVFLDTISRYVRGAARLLVLLGLLAAVVAAVLRPGGLGGRNRAEPGWATTIGRATTARWPWFEEVAIWTDRHRKGLAITLVAACCLVAAAWDRLTLGWGGAMLLTAAVGFSALMLLRPLIGNVVSANITPAFAGAAGPVRVGEGELVAAEPPRLAPPVSDDTRAAQVDPAIELSAGDVVILRRLAAALRDGAI